MVTSILVELGFPASVPIIIYEDDKSTVNIIHNGNDNDEEAQKTHGYCISLRS